MGSNPPFQVGWAALSIKGQSTQPSSPLKAFITSLLVFPILHFPLHYPLIPAEESGEHGNTSEQKRGTATFAPGTSFSHLHTMFASSTLPLKTHTDIIFTHTLQLIFTSQGVAGSPSSISYRNY
ncbi:hypothetical protein BABINDRAFT_153528 [Babjeviella inositovora NRRL Y-12698]|uniref:Uncharacterized protein n=1 Tax=Babjeviella inositovora NRRL Y-12698 TaxID=984486 RepID=A0A1E3QMY5_9ASCO|nr:uncharacterized protein BABINDRAFT_153528 [Babjeviella inositovora NRRL Y-12698]ODQ78824.1 hypothetical protein BABINDRAFT_153528 [Babjeviella inositovora NRRL Y-12698]